MYLISKLKKLARDLKQSSKEMNLLTNYDDTLLAMAELEGEGWLETQLNASKSDWLTVPCAIDKIRESQETIEEDRKALAVATDPKEINYLESMLEDAEEFLAGEIYGSGGGHRYFVRVTGEVVFSEMHGLDSCARKAKALGFVMH